MDQNFSLMAQSRANYYTAGSPVQFVRVELLKGDVTGEVAVCLTFKNVGTEPLTGFIIHFKCKDASGQILCEDDFYYEQLNVQPGELFGADDAVFVSDTPVSSVEIEQDRAFLNGRGVDLRNYKRVRLQAPRVLPGSIARTLQTRTNNKMLTCVPQDTENGWFCACGAFHPNEEAVSVCSECGGDRAYIKATLTRILEEARQAAEQQHGINEGNDAIAVHFGSSLLLAEWDWFLQGESAGRRPGGGAADTSGARVFRRSRNGLRPDPAACGDLPRTEPGFLASEDKAGEGVSRTARGPTAGGPGTAGRPAEGREPVPRCRGR